MSNPGARLNPTPVFVPMAAGAATPIPDRHGDRGIPGLRRRDRCLTTCLARPRNAAQFIYRWFCNAHDPQMAKVPIEADEIEAIMNR